MSKAFDIAFKLGAELTSSFKGSFEQASKSMKTLEEAGKRISSVGKTMSKTITAPIVATGVSMAKLAIDQDTAFAQVSTLLEGSAADFDQYKRDIRAASSEMGIAMEDYSEAVYSSISAGQSQGDAIEFTTKMAKLAGGGFTDVSKAVDVTTTALNAYKLESSEATNISDMLIMTQNLGKTTVDELAASMGKVIPIAEAQGVGFDQLSATYAVLTKNGLATAEAGTGMKAMFGELGKAGSKTDKILRSQTGKSFSELSAEGKNTGDVLAILQGEADKSGLKLSDLFGSVQAGGAALTLAAGGGEEFQEFLGEMANSAGATDEAFNTMADTAQGRMAVAWTTIKNVMAEFGDIMLPIIAEAAVRIKEITSKFQGMSPVVQKSILVFGAIAAAIGPALIVIGKVITAISSIGTLIGGLAGGASGLAGVMAVLTGPIGIAIAIIGGLIAVGVLLYKNWDLVKAKAVEVFSNFSPLLETVKGAFQNLVNSLAPVWESLKMLFESLKPILAIIAGLFGGALALAFGVFISTLSAVIAAIGPFINAVINIVDVVVNMVNVIIALLVGDFSSAWEYLQIISQSAADFFINIFSAIGNFIGTFVMTIIEFFHGLYMTLVGNSIIPDIVNEILMWFVNLITAGGELVMTFVNGVINGFLSMVTGISSAMGSAYDAVVGIWGTVMEFLGGINLFETGKTIINGMINGIKSMGSAVIGAIMDMIPAPIRGVASNLLGKIPGFAEGGIVNSPTLAWVGEGGDTEAIIPFNNSARSQRLWFETGSALGMFEPGEESGDGGVGDIDLGGIKPKGSGSGGGTVVHFKNTYHISGGNPTEVAEVIESSNDDLRKKLKDIKDDDERRRL